jgi:acyl-CoA thioester hydrolase
MTDAQTSFHFPVRVYWEDTDAGGIVFYANYLKYFERARTEWLRSLGVEQQALKQAHRLVFVVTHANLRYLRPARLDDLLQVSVVVQACGRASITLAQQAHCGSTLLVESTVRLGCVDAGTFRPQRVPNHLLEAIG